MVSAWTPLSDRSRPPTLVGKSIQTPDGDFVRSIRVYSAVIKLAGASAASNEPFLFREILLVLFFTYIYMLLIFMVLNNFNLSLTLHFFNLISILSAYKAVYFSCIFHTFFLFLHNSSLNLLQLFQCFLPKINC